MLWFCITDLSVTVTIDSDPGLAAVQSRRVALNGKFQSVNRPVYLTEVKNYCETYPVKILVLLFLID